MKKYAHLVATAVLALPVVAQAGMVIDSTGTSSWDNTCGTPTGAWTVVITVEQDEPNSTTTSGSSVYDMYYGATMDIAVDGYTHSLTGSVVVQSGSYDYIQFLGYSGGKMNKWIVHDPWGADFVPEDRILDGAITGWRASQTYFSFGGCVWQGPVSSVYATYDGGGDPCGTVDTDGDGVGDGCDVCPGYDDALDTDGDTTADGCDACPYDAENDADGDGVCEIDDNCDLDINENQSDVDADGVGDVCDPDDDNDGIDDLLDNCPLDTNADQADYDGDAIGDVCDADTDGDGVLDDIDTCLGTPVYEPVLDNGCSVDQECLCEGGWKNHGGYVSCVSNAAETLLESGLITEDEKGDMVSERAQSSCGHKKR